MINALKWLVFEFGGLMEDDIFYAFQQASWMCGGLHTDVFTSIIPGGTQ